MLWRCVPRKRRGFTQRLACSHHCSLGVADRSNGTLEAYASAYWSSVGQITPLNGLFSAPHGQAEQVLYLHDLSVVPELAGQGMARQLVQHLVQQARQRGLRQAALVAVQGADGYWARQGFSAYPVRDARQSLHLETYGDGARYMVATL